MVTATLGYRVLKHASHWPCVLGAVGGISRLRRRVHERQPATRPVIESPHYPWFQVSREAPDGSLVTIFDAGFRLRVDALTAIMLLTVTFISSFIAIYSIGYMHDDPGYPRFFAAMALFIASMTGLVLADNYILLYGCWEGVGLCSYLLIGFWLREAGGGGRGTQGVPRHPAGRHRAHPRHPHSRLLLWAARRVRLPL